MAARTINRFLRGHRLTALTLSSRRSLCSVKPVVPNSETGLITGYSLATPLPGLPTPKYAKASSQGSETNVTILDNGLKVASENRFGQFSTVGVIVDSGSRYESPYPSGVAHFLEKLSFGKTSKWENRDKIIQDLAQVGGICDCQAARDTIVYAASARTDGLAKVMDILSDVVLRPEFPDHQMEETRMGIGFELENMHTDPFQTDRLLMEMIHTAAYRGNTLGLPRVCAEESIAIMTRELLYKYLQERHTPKNMVVAGVGMDHDSLVSLTQKMFVDDKKPIWLPGDAVWGQGLEGPQCVSQYTGGSLLVEKDLSDVSMGPNPLPNLAHVVFGVESCGHKDPDFIAYCVLNMMMGGGGSFSAGGPGKGMYTRLYLNVLNRYNWIENATTYNHAYGDSGLFCIHASAHPDKLKDLVQVILREMVATFSTGVYKDELARAKRQLQSMMMMNLESRPVVFEDIGRQVLSEGNRKTPQYYMEEIGKITAKDIHRVAERMLKTKLSVVAYGDLKELPPIEDMETCLHSKDGTMPKKMFASVF